MGMKKRSRRSQTSFGNSASIQSSWPSRDPGMNEYPTRERRGSVSTVNSSSISVRYFR